MKNPLLKFAATLLLLPLLSRAQEYRISGRVIEAITERPIPFAAVMLKQGKVGIISDQHGYFELMYKGRLSTDSLIISVNSNRVAKQIELSNAEDKVIVIKNVPPRLCSEPGAFCPPSQYAFLINPTFPKHQAKLRTVSIYMDDEYGFACEFPRLRIYKSEGDSSINIIGADLLDENVWLFARKRGIWFTVDLSHLNITVARNGLFLAVEYVPLDGLRNGYEGLENYKASGYVMQPEFDFANPQIWYCERDLIWKRKALLSGAYGRYSAMIRIEVEP